MNKIVKMIYENGTIVYFKIVSNKIICEGERFGDTTPTYNIPCKVILVWATINKKVITITQEPDIVFNYQADKEYKDNNFMKEQLEKIGIRIE